MKKLICFLLIFTVMFAIPVSVFAEGEEETTSDETTTEEVTSSKVQIYFFRGDGCPHCQEAEEWFDGLDKDLKSKFDLIDFETWYDKENSTLMSEVAEARGESESATGVPYIIIGDKSWVGFASSMSDEITKQIEDVYEQEPSERYDVMKLIGYEVDRSNIKEDEEEEESNDVLALILVLVVVGGLGFGIYKARKTV